MCLCDVEKEKEYIIEDVGVKDDVIKTKLKNFGIVKGEKIKFLNYNYGKSSLLIKVMNVNYAIDKRLCEKIKVKDEQ